MNKSSSSRQFVFVLLAFLLAFAQQAGIAHALSHVQTAQRTQQEKHLPAEKACDKCLAFASLDGVAQSGDAKTPAPPSYDVFVPTDAKLVAVAVVTPYLTRAPPRPA